MTVKSRVFLSYSRKDKRWLEELRTMLAPLVRNELLDVWWDGAIRPSQEWREEIDRAMESAGIGVLLVSPSFLASDFIAKEELPFLVEAARRKKVTLFWVLLSPCLYEHTPLVEIQAAHDLSRPLDSLKKSERTAVLKEICQRIAEAAPASPLSWREPAAGRADTLHQVGRWEESEEAFRRAEALQKQWQPWNPRLYSLWGYRYCDLLLNRREPEDGSVLDGLAEGSEAARRFRKRCLAPGQAWEGRTEHAVDRT